jgi:hypothetical protein
MAKSAIKSQEDKNAIANAIAGKLRIRLNNTFGNTCKVDTVEVSEEITHVIVTERHHGITFAVSDTIREVTSQYENQYGWENVTTYLDTRNFIYDNSDVLGTEIVVVVLVRANI